MTIADGQIVTAADLDDALTAVHRVAVKPTATDRDTTTTLTDDPDLTLSVEPGVTYTGRIVLYANSVASNAGDLRLRLAFPAGSTVSFGMHGLDPAITSGFTDEMVNRMVEATTSPTSTMDFGLSSTFTVTVGWFVITAGSAGSLTLQWAQVSSNANASRLRAGSHLILERAN